MRERRGFPDFARRNGVLGVRNGRAAANGGNELPARRRRWSLAAAAVAACLLVLQSVLGALAYGTGPEAAQLDVFGNVICTHTGTGTLPTGSVGHSVPPCCAYGCMVATAVFSAPPLSLAIARDIAFEPVSFRRTRLQVLQVARTRSPANPRAPPAAA